MTAIYTQYLLLSRMRYMFRHFHKVIIKPRYKNLTKKTQFQLKMRHVLIITPTGCSNFSFFEGDETLNISNSNSLHQQEFFAVHIAMVYAIEVC